LRESLQKLQLTDCELKIALPRDFGAHEEYVSHSSSA
jgi:hypothetical protein